MHELGLAEAILSVVGDIAGDRRVTRVAVRIGVEQRVAADSLEFGFQLLAEDTGCDGAALQCIAVPGLTVLVDEVELDGDPPTIVRRPGSEVTESQHAHLHSSVRGAAPAPVGSVKEQGGA
jgi:Hydrogenase/urease nickel incorporation, metallochaperone, hypA